MSDFGYKIMERVAVLSSTDDGGYTAEVNLISYNGRKPKIDIRRWERHEGAERMLKGIALDEKEAAALLEALQKAL